MQVDGVYEIARLTIEAKAEQDFMRAAAESLSILREAPGCRSANVLGCIEAPGEPVFLVHWDSVAAHEAFRMGDTFASYREPIQTHFTSAPTFVHYRVDPEGH